MKGKSQKPGTPGGNPKKRNPMSQARPRPGFRKPRNGSGNPSGDPTNPTTGGSVGGSAGGSAGGPGSYEDYRGTDREPFRVLAPGDEPVAHTPFAGAREIRVDCRVHIESYKNKYRGGLSATQDPEDPEGETEDPTASGIPTGNEGDNRSDNGIGNGPSRFSDADVSEDPDAPPETTLPGTPRPGDPETGIEPTLTPAQQRKRDRRRERRAGRREARRARRRGETVEPGAEPGTEDSGEGKIYDVSDDIIGISINRVMDAPSTASVTIANEGDKYRNLFMPQDRIRIWSRRDETEYVSFTGYIRRNPYFSIVSQREITLECEDVISRLVQKEWDPNLPENINAVSSYIPASQVGRYEEMLLEGGSGGGRTGEDPNAPLDSTPNEGTEEDPEGEGETGDDGGLAGEPNEGSTEGSAGPGSRGGGDSGDARVLETAGVYPTAYADAEVVLDRPGRASGTPLAEPGMSYLLADEDGDGIDDETGEPVPEIPDDPNGNPEGEEGAENPEGEPEDELAGPDGSEVPSLGDAVWPDETLAFILTDENHINLDPSLVWIEQFPETWKTRAAEIDAQVDYCSTPYKDLIICPDEDGGVDNPCETGSGPEGTGGSSGAGPASESKQDIAKYIAQEAVKRDMPPELPVITALVESEMNPKLGMNESDLDSAGLYQQRSHYGSEEDRMDVKISTGWFLDEAEIYRRSVGPDDAGAIGEWAADTQRPAEQYRYRYATRFDEARQLIGDSADLVDSNYNPNRFADASADASADATADATEGFPGCDAGKEAIAKWMAGESEAAGLPKTLLPILSLIEGGLSCRGESEDNAGGPLFGLTGGSSTSYLSYSADEGLQNRIERAKSLQNQYDAPDDDCDGLTEWIAAMQVNEGGAEAFKPACQEIFDMLGAEGESGERPDGSFDPEEAPCGSGSGSEGGGTGGTDSGGVLNVAGGSICCDYMAGCSIAQNPHAGVDVCAPTGSEIKAWGDGTVILTKVASGYNQMTTIDFGGEYVLFGHLLSGSTPATGASVKGGDIIGKVGTSADAMGTDPHAHIQCFTSESAALGFDNGAVKDPKEVHAAVTGSARVVFPEPSAPKERTVFAPVDPEDQYELSVALSEGLSREDAEARVYIARMRRRMDAASYTFGTLGMRDPDDHMTMHSEGAVCLHCGNESDTPGFVRSTGEPLFGIARISATGNPPNGWSLVNDDREIVYSIDTKYGSIFEKAAGIWSSLGGVKLRKGTSGVTCRVYDTNLSPSGVMGRTSSEGWIAFDPGHMDSATENAKLCCALHEIGHALGFPDINGDSPRSVMNTPITGNSSSNPDQPTDHDIQEFKEVWGGDGTVEGGGEGGEENTVLKEFLTKGLECVGAPYRWGGGHGETMSSTAEIKERGVDCSGLYNMIRILMGLEPGDVGPTGSYETFITNTSDFDPSKSYPVGTILNNPGGGSNGVGHIAMVSDEQGHILEANGGAGRVINTNTISSGNEGWEGFTTAGEMPDVGTADSVGTGGEGEGPHTGEEDGDSEPCIMKNPLGPYKLVWMAAGLNESSWVRSAALNDGNTNATVEAQLATAETAMDYNPHILETESEDRDWTELGEYLKEPYLPTIQGIAASGLYRFMTVGTGEIVFWYPHFIIEREAYFLLPDGFEDKPEEERRDYWHDMTFEEKAKLYGSLPEERFDEVFPWISDGGKARLDEYLANNPGLVSPEDTPPSERTSDYSPSESENVDFLRYPMVVKDIELRDFHLEVSDEELVTHYFVLGDFRLDGFVYAPMQLEIKCQRWATVKHHPFLSSLAEENKFDYLAFLERYGSRTLREEVPALKTPGLAQLYADNEFLRRWLQNYTVSIDIAFMPELYPGMKLHIESLGIQVSILSVNMTMGDSWTTSVACSMPLEIEDESKVPPMPFWALGSVEDTQQGVSPENPEGVNRPGQTPGEVPEVPVTEDDELGGITDDILSEGDQRQRDFEDEVRRMIGPL